MHSLSGIVKSDLIKPMDSLAYRLKLARDARGYTQGELAERAGVQQPYISKIERGAARKSTVILQLARALNVNPEWLDTGDGEMTGSTVIRLGPVSKEESLKTAMKSLGLALANADKLTRLQAGLVLQALVENPDDATELANKLQRTLNTQSADSANNKAA